MGKKIIFDLGGVIEKIDPQAVTENFSSLGMANSENFFSLLRQSDICSKFEVGEINRKSFIHHLKKKCAENVSAKEVESAWCSNQLGVSEKTVKSLRKLKKKNIDLFILSNTNPIHTVKIEQNFERKFGIKFRTLFNEIYYSFEIGCRKPRKQAYQYAINKIKPRHPKDCIYIDDLGSNLTAPKALGLHCIHHKTNADIDISLRELLH